MLHTHPGRCVAVLCPAENEAFLADQARERAVPANKFNIRNHSVSDVDVDGMASPDARRGGEDSKEGVSVGRMPVDDGADGSGRDAYAYDGYGPDDGSGDLDGGDSYGSGSGRAMDSEATAAGDGGSPTGSPNGIAGGDSGAGVGMRQS